VIFVNGRSRAEIADVMASRLEAERAAEKMRGLRDVLSIARARLAKLQPLP